MSFQKLEKFAKFLKFNYIAGNFEEGQIIYDNKFYSQLNSSSEDRKIKDLAHELAHFILANNSDYRKKNFGLDLPGFGSETSIEEMACVLSWIIMNHFNIDSNLIYEEIIETNYEDQEMIDKSIDLLIEKEIIEWISGSKILKSKNSKIRTAPKSFLIPKLFKLNHSILRRK